MAAQTIPMPNEVPAEIKVVIDKVLDGFNGKDSGVHEREQRNSFPLMRLHSAENTHRLS